MYSILTEHTSLGALQQALNRVTLSKLRTIDHPVMANSFGIKYVVQGVEHYHLNDSRYTVTTGQYLLANRHCEGRGMVDSPTIVTGICIGIDQNLLAEVVASYRQPGSLQPDWALDRFFQTPDFMEQQYQAADTRLGGLLRGLAQHLTQPGSATLTFTDELYYRLAESIVADHIPVYRQLQHIPAVKWSTRKDLYKRVAHGKAFMDADFTQSPAINTIAREAGISEYHFFRLFRAMYGISPHQYLLQQKLTCGYRLLQQGASVTTAATTAGFADIFSFSRAFRKRYATHPSAVTQAGCGESCAV